LSFLLISLFHIFDNWQQSSTWVEVVIRIPGRRSFALAEALYLLPKETSSPIFQLTLRPHPVFRLYHRFLDLGMLRIARKRIVCW
jgi:hypothetical protein